MAAYADADDLVARYDARVIGDLLDDSDKRISESELSGNSVVTASLEGASGEVESKALRGNRYSAADLAGLTGNSLAFLKDIVCALAMLRLHKRRGWGYISDSIKDAVEYAERQLKALGSGEAIFNVEDVRDAGQVSVTAVSRVVIDREWELVADKVRGHLYPKRRSYRNG